MKYKAVIFDLFGTLIDNFSNKEHRDTLRQMALVCGAPPDEFIKLWFDSYIERFTGVFPEPYANIAWVCDKLGVKATYIRINRAAEIRLDFEKRAMLPRPGAVETLTRLKSEGYKIGLITDCSEEVPEIWQSTLFAPLVDVPVFSCVEHIKKPDPAIYRLAAERLRVKPQDCLYIGDGSSRELSGATAAGMRAVLLRVPEEDAHAIDREEWAGPAVSSFAEVLRLVE